MYCLRLQVELCKNPLCGYCNLAVRGVELDSGKNISDLNVEVKDSGHLLQVTDPNATDSEKKFFMVSRGCKWSVKGIAEKNIHT